MVASASSNRVLEPMERIAEVLFGLIMVLTYTAHSASSRRIAFRSGLC